MRKRSLRVRGHERRGEAGPSVGLASVSAASLAAQMAPLGTHGVWAQTFMCSCQRVIRLAAR